MNKLDLLRAISFGSRIAEDEAAELKSYFVQTDTWMRIFGGEIDVIYGNKGAGKSAIYAVLTEAKNELRRRKIILATAENPRGATVFKDLVSDPPTSEIEFVSLWKLYFLTLIGEAFRNEGIVNEPAKLLARQLEDAELLALDASLHVKLRSAFQYVRRLIALESVSTTIEVDPYSGLPKGLTGKISLREPTTEQKKHGVRSIDNLLQLAQSALDEADMAIWLLLDRLDVAFADAPDLERNGIRALFKVYLDLFAYPRIKPKIFIRTDIWRRITAEGFREASHITRTVTISWNDVELLNLIVRRILKNRLVIEQYRLNESEILASSDAQRQLFGRIFPEKVDLSEKKPTTFDWIISRCRDGTGNVAPREIIHLLSATRDEQVRKLERGDSEPASEMLFVGQGFKDALPEVSKARFENTLLAEYPNFRGALLKLEGKRTQQSAETLAELWSLSPEEAQGRANSLAEIGFFEPRSTREGKQYWIPFLYRPCLSLVQGSED